MRRKQFSKHAENNKNYSMTNYIESQEKKSVFARICELYALLAGNRLSSKPV
jgi:hypothetical protein